MTQTETVENGSAPPEAIQKDLHELALRVGQLEAERTLLEQENKSLRFMLERVIDHRQKSHSELVLLITGLVSRLQISDVGAVVSRLVEHNSNVSQYLAAPLAVAKPFGELYVASIAVHVNGWPERVA